MKLTDSPDSPANRLRLATWRRHQRIEKCDILKRVFASDYRLDEYAILLERVYGFYGVVEPLLAEALAGDQDSPFRRPPKASLLALDLAGLGRGELGLADLPLCSSTPKIETSADVIGVSYVLEGATMGGIYISKHLARHFGDAVESFLAFYRSYGDATLPQWEAFKEALNRFLADEAASSDAVIQASDATYLSFTDWLEQTTP